MLGVVENMSFPHLAGWGPPGCVRAGGGGALAQEAAVDFLGAIPLDPDVRAVGDVGVPVVETVSGQLESVGAEGDAPRVEQGPHGAVGQQRRTGA